MEMATEEKGSRKSRKCVVSDNSSGDEDVDAAAVPSSRGCTIFEERAAYQGCTKINGKKKWWWTSMKKRRTRLRRAQVTSEAVLPQAMEQSQSPPAAGKAKLSKMERVVAAL